MSERRILRKLRALQGPMAYPAPGYQEQQNPREALEEALDYRRTNLAEELLKIATESWGNFGEDSLVAMAHSCNEAASVIYPELEPEVSDAPPPTTPYPRPGSDLVVPPLPTREGMLSVAGGPRHELEAMLDERSIRERVEEFEVGD